VLGRECEMLWKGNGDGSGSASGELKLLLWDDVDPADALAETAERSRVTMYEVQRFTAYHKYKVVIVENVLGIFRWWRFQGWLREMLDLGYRHKIIIGNTQFAPPFPHPVPQSRNRVYIVFWREGLRDPDLDYRPVADCQKCGARVRAKQVFKNPLKPWGDYGDRRSWYYVCEACRSSVRPDFAPASSIIDWSLPARTIGERVEKGEPLSESTMRRIQYGLERFSGPLLVETVYTHSRSPHGKTRPLTEPMQALTKRQSLALAVPPFMVDLRGTAENQLAASPRSIDEPL